MEERCCGNCEYCEVDSHKSCCVNVASEHCARIVDKTKRNVCIKVRTAERQMNGSYRNGK